MSWYGGFRPYVPVARRRAQAATYAASLAKKEKRALCPVKIDGRKIAHTFWGLAWCDNLERYSDFANRLPRGRTYVRNGSVIDLQIESGRIKAIVSGSAVYRVTIDIQSLPPALWKAIKRDCSQSIDSLIDLLQGRFDEGVMGRLTQRDGGLFPRPREISMKCSCPDWAGLCKHVAAVLYGVGSRLDTDPELLFKLRDVDHLELVGTALAAENLDRAMSAGSEGALSGDLGEIFGIDIEANNTMAAPRQSSAKAVSVQVVAAAGRVSDGASPKMAPKRASSTKIAAVAAGRPKTSTPKGRKSKKEVLGRPNARARGKSR